MTADVIEAAQLTLRAAHQQQRFAQKLGGKKVARLRQLFTMSNHLPRTCEDPLVFLRPNPGIDIERRLERTTPAKCRNQSEVRAACS